VGETITIFYETPLVYCGLSYCIFYIDVILIKPNGETTYLVQNEQGGGRGSTTGIAGYPPGTRTVELVNSGTVVDSKTFSVKDCSGSQSEKKVIPGTICGKIEENFAIGFPDHFRRCDGITDYIIKTDAVGAYFRITDPIYENIPCEFSYCWTIVGWTNWQEISSCDDCATNPCSNHCSNNIQDCGESGVDCGGECSSCPQPCDNHCYNSIQDCGESGVDCGGECSSCPQPCDNHCSNGIQDCGETGVDCGGECIECISSCPNDYDPDNPNCTNQCHDFDKDRIPDCRDKCPYVKEILYDTDFNVKRDAYKFSNLEFTAINGTINLAKLETLILIHPALQLLGKDILLSTINILGNCYGMSSTSALYYRGKIQLPDINGYPYMYDPKDPQISTRIIEYQESQFSWFMATLIDRLYLRYDSNREFIRLKDNLSIGNPVVLCLGEDNFFVGKHAVVAISICSAEAEDSNVINLYDNNHPSELSRASYNTRNNSFNYVGYNRFAVIEINEIAIINTKSQEEINQYIYNIFKDFLGISLRSPADLRIVDENGRIIGYDNGIFLNQIPQAISFQDENNQIFFVPKNLNYRIEIIGNGTGESHFGLLQTSNEMKEISYPPIPTTPEIKAEISISSNSQDYDLKIDTNGDGSYDKSIEPNKISIITKEGKIIGKEESFWKKFLKGSPFAQYGMKSLLLIGLLILGNALILIFSRRKR
jgi:hypothetical protein